MTIDNLLTINIQKKKKLVGPQYNHSDKVAAKGPQGLRVSGHLVHCKKKQKKLIIHVKSIRMDVLMKRRIGQSEKVKKNPLPPKNDNSDINK